MKLIAKPIIKNQYWVVTDGDKKVGNVFANESGFDVKLNGNIIHYKDTKEIRKEVSIEFQPDNMLKKAKEQLPFPEYPTTKKVYNSILDIKRKLHLFTKTLKSKCYYAAGWFVVYQGNDPQIVFCPKYIFIQRYEYDGPYKTETEAKDLINIT